MGVADYFVKSENLEALEKALELSIHEDTQKEDIHSILKQYAEKVEAYYENEEKLAELFFFTDFRAFYENLKNSKDEFSTKVTLNKDTLKN